MAGFFGNSKIAQNLSNLLNVVPDFNTEIIKQSYLKGKTESNMAYVGMPEKMRRALSMSDVTSQPYYSIFDLSYPERKNRLTDFAQNSEIRWCLNIIADEAIVYNDENYYLYPTLNLSHLNLSEEVEKEIQDELQKQFRLIYQAWNFHRGNAAWDYMLRYLITGFEAYEIIFDKNGDNIIAFKELDPFTIMPDYQTNAKGETIKVWQQFPNNIQLASEVIPDEKIIYISYAKSNDTSGQISYIESMYRNFNIKRRLENSLAVWWVMNSQFRMKTDVDVGDHNQAKAKEIVSEVIDEMNEQLIIDEKSGEISVQGKKELLYFKNFGVGIPRDGNRLEISTIGGDGPDLQNTSIIEYFQKQLIIDSQIPSTRWNREGNSWQMNMAGTDLEEIRFSRFIDQQRVNREEMFRKPLEYMLRKKFPELAKNREFLSTLGFRYVSNSYFERLKEFELLGEEVNHISTLSGLVDEEGTPLIPLEWLARKYLSLTPQDWDEIDKWKASESEDESDDKKDENDEEIRYENRQEMIKKHWTKLYENSHSNIRNAVLGKRL